MRLVYKNSIKECTVATLKSDGLYFYYEKSTLFTIKGLSTSVYNSILMELAAKGVVNLNSIPEENLNVNQYVLY